MFRFETVPCVAKSLIKPYPRKFAKMKITKGVGKIEILFVPTVGKAFESEVS